MGTWHFLLLVVACLHSTMAKYDFMKGDDSDRHSGGYPPHDFGNSRATYQRGGYDIYCPDGFREDGKGGCIDVDECTKGRIIRCGLNADCFNKKGSYVCLCRPGFKKNAHGHCVDINECDKYLDLCTDDENCLNVIGTYHCLCKAGYFKDAHGNCKKPGLKKNDKYDPYYPPHNRYPDPHDDTYPPKYPTPHKSGGYPDPHDDTYPSKYPTPHKSGGYPDPHDDTYPPKYPPPKKSGGYPDPHDDTYPPKRSGGYPETTYAPKEKRLYSSNADKKH